MRETNTIFGNKTAAARPKNPDPKPQLRAPRKTRSDKKHDIKFRLSLADKQNMSFRALDHNLSLTAFASMIVENELIRDMPFDDFDYDDKGQFVHVMLDELNFKKIQSMAITENISFRRVAHRIIKNYLWRSSGGIKIKIWS